MDHPHSVTFARSWGPCGVVLDSHFIVIFFNTSPTVPSAAAQFISNQPPIGSHASSVILNHCHHLDGANTPSYAHSHSHSNSPVPAFPIGANHMNYFLSKAMSSQNSPVPSYPHYVPILPLSIDYIDNCAPNTFQSQPLSVAAINCETTLSYLPYNVYGDNSSLTVSSTGIGSHSIASNIAEGTKQKNN